MTRSAASETERYNMDAEPDSTGTTEMEEPTDSGMVDDGFITVGNLKKAAMNPEMVQTMSPRSKLRFAMRQPYTTPDGAHRMAMVGELSKVASLPDENAVESVLGTCGSSAQARKDAWFCESFVDEMLADSEEWRRWQGHKNFCEAGAGFVYHGDEQFVQDEDQPCCWACSTTGSFAGSGILLDSSAPDHVVDDSDSPGHTVCDWAGPTRDYLGGRGTIQERALRVHGQSRSLFCGSKRETNFEYG